MTTDPVALSAAKPAACQNLGASMASVLVLSIDSRLNTLRRSERQLAVWDGTRLGH
jgi:hypothetical protein